MGETQTLTPRVLIRREQLSWYSIAASVDSLCLTTVSQVLASRAKFGLRETATICFEGQDSVSQLEDLTNGIGVGLQKGFVGEVQAWYRDFDALHVQVSSEDVDLVEQVGVRNVGPLAIHGSVLSPLGDTFGHVSHYIVGGAPTKCSYVMIGGISSHQPLSHQKFFLLSDQNIDPNLEFMRWIERPHLTNRFKAGGYISIT